LKLPVEVHVVLMHASIAALHAAADVARRQENPSHHLSLTRSNSRTRDSDNEPKGLEIEMRKVVQQVTNTQ